MKLYKSIISGFAAGMLMFSGCGGDDSTDTTTTTTSEPTVQLSGSIDTSSLSSSDQAEVRTRARAFRADGDAKVLLYKLNEDGDAIPTNDTCTVTGTDYNCPGVAGNTEYIVRYVQDIGGGKVLEMKTSASVGTTDVASVTVDPISTLIAEAVVSAVKEALVGITSDEALVESIAASVKQAVEDTITTLIATGTIQIPSLLIEEDYAAITVDSNVTENENLDTATGAILSDPTVTATTDVLVAEAESDAYDTASNTEKLESVFKAIGWDENPGWVLTMFSAEYNNMKAAWTFGWFRDHMLAENVEINATTLANDYERYQWDIENLVRMGAIDGTGDTNASFVQISADTAAEFQSYDLLALLKSELDTYYTIQAKPFEERNQTELEYMAEFPAAITNEFSETFVAALDANTEMLTMGQLFVFMGYTEKLVEDAARNVINAAIDSLQSTTGSDVSIDNVRVMVDDKGNFLQDMYTQNELLAYDGITLEPARLRSERYYDGTDSYSYISVDWVSLSRLGWDMDISVPDANLLTNATLTYPTSGGGTSTVDLDVSTDHGLGFTLRPWYDNGAGGYDFNTSKAITDAVTGDFVVNVTYDGNSSYESTRSFTVMQGVDTLRPKMTSPKGYPQYPEDYDTNATAAAAFDAEMNAFQTEGATNYLPNSEDNDSLEGAVFTWQAPDLTGVTIPDGIIMAYSVHISLTQVEDFDSSGVIDQDDWNVCNQNWESCNQEIYNTWWDNKPVTTNSITLPVPLQVISGEDQYSIGVNVMFIDEETGQEVAQGEGDWAQFTVGAGTALNGDELITFTGALNLYSDAGYDATFPSNAVMALVSEENYYNETTGYWESNNTIVATGTIDTNSSYSIDVNVTTLRENMGQNKYINLVLFNDSNPTNGLWDNIWDANTQGEDSYWTDGKWMNIDNWGDLIIHTSSQDGTHTSQKVLQGTDVNVTGLDITIW